MFCVRILILMDHAFCFMPAWKYSSFAQWTKSPFLQTCIWGRKDETWKAIIHDIISIVTSSSASFLCKKNPDLLYRLQGLMVRWWWWLEFGYFLFLCVKKVFASHKWAHWGWISLGILSIVPNNYLECLFGFFASRCDKYSYTVNMQLKKVT